LFRLDCRIIDLKTGNYEEKRGRRYVIRTAAVLRTGKKEKGNSGVS
jgi:hypothetical protein